MSSEKIDEHEKRLNKIEQEIAIRKEVERVIEHEKSGLFKSLINLFKVIAALIILLTAGDQALSQYPWIKDLIK